MPNKNKVGSITLAQAAEIAKTKMPDLNAASLEDVYKRQSVPRWTASVR